MIAVAARIVATDPRRILLFGDEEAARPFVGQGWEASALREFGVEVLVRALPTGVRERVLAAQKRQRRCAVQTWPSPGLSAYAAKVLEPSMHDAITMGASPLRWLPSSAVGGLFRPAPSW